MVQVQDFVRHSDSSLKSFLRGSRVSDIVRFGVSLPRKLSDDFDKYIAEDQYTNRSEAIRDLIRNELIKDEWQHSGTQIAGAIIFVYDHHVRNLLDKIVTVQHDFHGLIISGQHIHLDHDNCLEILAVRGESGYVQALYKKIKALKGVKHISLNMSSTGQNIS
ncbi:nickel-responsive transcriptional regulator NikR [Candidatus Haliotispira prima]|uniref:Putative nickel-responsive regulator n=1 Tax=Candidatus Haliotispira prima TaxID=3034016 RepID=A0ABY8MN41_9SPIO|nr:nickel-responsive transcriptional regulator NikR [Candidatus Haliotispira prima]